MLERWFHLSEAGTTPRRELTAGLTTFLAMAYIVVVNPAILGDAGIDPGAAFVATCLAAALGSALMGLLANHPIALAPGMGLNAYVAYSVVGAQGVSWQVALGLVFWSGLAFVLLSVLPVRAWLIESIPKELQLAVSAGIGLFLGLIGLRNAGLVVDHPSTLVSIGDLLQPGPMLAFLGFVCIVALAARGVVGAVSLGILGVTAVGVLSGVSPIVGVVAAPPPLAPTLFAADLVGALDPVLLPVIGAILFVDLFDTAGTLVGVGHQGRLLDANGRLPRLGRALLADSLATTGGALLGTSPTTSYIESAAGIQTGGRTGLTALTVAVLFLACLGFAPLAQTIPPYATAPALLFVAALMVKALAELPWSDVATSAPAVLTALAVPLTFSISDGIGLGFTAYAGIQVLTGRASTCPPALYVIAGLWIVKVAWT